MEKEIRLAQLEEEHKVLVNDSIKWVLESEKAGADTLDISVTLMNLDEQIAENLEEQASLRHVPLIKFMYNGIKVDGKLHKGFYSKGSYHKDSGIPAGTITIYARDYGRFPRIQGLVYHNETDSQTDYFDTDKVRIFPNNKHYSAVEKAYIKQEERRAKVLARKTANV